MVCRAFESHEPHVLGAPDRISTEPCVQLEEDVYTIRQAMICTWIDINVVQSSRYRELYSVTMQYYYCGARRFFFVYPRKYNDPSSSLCTTLQYIGNDQRRCATADGLA